MMKQVLLLILFAIVALFVLIPAVWASFNILWMAWANMISGKLW